MSSFAIPSALYQYRAVCDVLTAFGRLGRPGGICPRLTGNGWVIDGILRDDDMSGRMPQGLPSAGDLSGVRFMKPNKLGGTGVGCGAHD